MISELKKAIALAQRQRAGGTPYSFDTVSIEDMESLMACCAIVRDLASKKPPAYNGTCLLCHFADEDEATVNHSPDCPYRRAVEWTR